MDICLPETYLELLFGVGLGFFRQNLTLSIRLALKSWHSAFPVLRLWTESHQAPYAILNVPGCVLLPLHNRGVSD